MLIIQGVSVYHQKCKRAKRQSCIWRYIYSDANHTIYIRRRTTSAVYFMYNSRAHSKQNQWINQKSQGQKKPRSWIITIKGRTWQGRNRVFRRNLLSIEFWRLLHYSLNRWRPLVPQTQCFLMLILTVFVFCKRVCKLSRNTKLIQINTVTLVSLHKYQILLN